MRSGLSLASIIVLTSSAAFAQSERVTLRAMPAPNQTIHFRAVQEMAMEITPDASATISAPVPATSTVFRTTFVSTMTVGAPNENGSVVARTMFDEMSIEATANGQPVPTPREPTLVGKTITTTYDDLGKVSRVTSDAPELQQALDAMAGMLNSGMNPYPLATLGVGETATVPFKLATPIASPGIPPLNTASETTFTLTSITSAGADRIAHFATRVTTKLDQASEAARGPVTMDVQTTLTGTMDWNVTRSFMQAGEQHGTIDGVLRVPGVGVPPMRVHGTLKITTAGQ